MPTAAKPKRVTKKPAKRRTLADPRVLAEVMAKYRAELPALLKSHAEEWVAYTVEGERVKGESQFSIIDELVNRRGESFDRFIISRIEEETDSEITWVDR